MGISITGPFGHIAKIRNFFQGDVEPYINYSRGGYRVEALADDIGNGLAIVFLTEAKIAGKTPAQVASTRKRVIDRFSEHYPHLEINKI